MTGVPLPKGKSDAQEDHSVAGDSRTVPDSRKFLFAEPGI
jgi:hypothetical protein